MTNKSKILLSILGSVAISAPVIYGAYHLIKQIYIDTDYEISIFSDSSVSIDSILVNLGTNNDREKLPSELTDKDLSKYLDFNNLAPVLEPNIVKYFLNYKYIMDISLIEDSRDDYNGTISLLFKYKEKTAISLPWNNKIILITGFNRINKGSYPERKFLSDNLSSLANNLFFNIDSNNENILSQVSLSNNFILENDKYLSKNEELGNYELTAQYVESASGKLVELTLQHTEKNNVKLSKFFTIKNSLKNNLIIWQSQEEIARQKWYKVLTLADIHTLKSQELIKLFSKNNQNIDSIEIISKASNDLTGTIYLKAILNNGEIYYAKFIVYTFAHLFDEFWQEYSKKNNFHNFLTALNDPEYTDKIINNTTSDIQNFNYRFELITNKFRIFYENKIKNIKNEINFVPVNNMLDFREMKVLNNQLSFLVITANTIRNPIVQTLPTLNPNSDNNNNNWKKMNKYSSKIKTLESVEEDIKKRTIAISYLKVSDKKDSYVSISGTAWIFDKSRTEKNVYYLATNSHVVEELQKNWNDIFAFTYSVVTDSNSFNDLSLDSSVSQFEKERRVIFKDIENQDQVPSFFNSYKENFSNKTFSKKFWKTFKIYNLGSNFPDEGQFRDISIIKVQFPESNLMDLYPDTDFHFYSNNYLNSPNYFPEAAAYYDQQEKKPETKLKFYKNDTDLWPDSLGKEPIMLPSTSITGGYLGGKTWIGNNGIGFLSYVFSNREMEYFDDKHKSIGKFDGSKLGITMPRIKGGKGMSGSMVMNKYGEVVGIFWGGKFEEGAYENSLGALEYGTGIIEPIGIKIKGRQSLLEKWLELTKNEHTNLDHHD